MTEPMPTTSWGKIAAAQASQGDTPVATLTEEDRQRLRRAFNALPYGAAVMHLFDRIQTVEDIADTLEAFAEVLRTHADGCNARERQLHGLLGDVAAVRRLFGLEGEGTVRPMGYGEGV